jgi:LuxR family maltose regulon positive regulatory protein
MPRDYYPLSDRIIHRPRVNALIEKGIEYPLVTIIAGPGYGKTMAMVDYCRTTKRRVIWLRLMKLDNETDLFWQSFIRAVRREMPALAAELEPLVFPAMAGEFDSFLRLFARHLYSGPGAILVMDSAENIDEPGVKAFVDALVEAEMEGLTTVLISNQRLTRMAVLGEGKYYHLSAGELCFNDDEACQLFKLLGVRASRNAVHNAVEQTGGWPLALHLLCTQPADSDTPVFGDTPRYQLLAELFERGHYIGYDDETRRMLVRLSFFNNIPLELVRAIGVKDMKKSLDALSHNIFITYDYGAKLFSFHSMYHDFLTGKQGMLGENEVRELLTLAGGWFLANGYAEDAMDCYWRIKDYVRFLNAMRTLPIRRGRTSVTTPVLRRLNEFPAEYAERDSRVDFGRAFMYLNSMQVMRAREIFESVRQRLEERDRTAEDDLLLGDVYMVLADISVLQGNCDGLEYVKKAAALLPNGCRIRAEKLLVVENNEVFYIPDDDVTGPDEMITYHTEFAHYADSITNGSGIGFDLLFAAEAYYYTGHTDMAMEYSQKAVYRAKPTHQHDIVCNALVLQMRVALFRGDGGGALAVMEEIEKYIDAENVVELHPLRDCVRGWLHLWFGEFDKVAGWITGQARTATEMPLALGRDKLFEALYHMQKGNRSTAYAALLELDPIFEQRSLWTAKVQSHIIKSICLMASGQENRSMDELWTAYSMTHRHGITVIFVEYGNDILPILEVAAAQQRYSFDAAWLTKVCEEARDCARRTAGMRKTMTGQRPSQRVRGVALTERENEVLRYLASGLVRDEIAAMLGISINGVKKHITNIYTKLGAVNRVDAIHIAVSSGIIEL